MGNKIWILRNEFQNNENNLNVSNVNFYSVL